MGQGDSQDGDKDEHLDDAVPAELVQEHSPWIEEDGLDVEDDEEHRRQVEAHRSALPGRNLRNNARLVGKQLAPVRLARPEEIGKSDQQAYEGHHDDSVDEERDVVAEHSISMQGSWGTGLILVGARDRTAPGPCRTGGSYDTDETQPLDANCAAQPGESDSQRASRNLVKGLFWWAWLNPLHPPGR